MSTPYHPPPGGLSVFDPRTPSDIIVRSIGIHIFALCAYDNLAQLLRWNTSRLLHAWQLYIFASFPEIILIQLVHHVLMHFHISRRVLLLSYYLPDLLSPLARSSLLGSRYELDPFETSNSVVEGLPATSRLGSRAQFPTLRLLFSVVLAVPLVVTIVAYSQRLSIRYLKATYVGNLLLDHRNGWVAIGGTIAGTASVLILLVTPFRPSVHTPTKLSPRTTITASNIHSLSHDLILLQAGLVSIIHLVLLNATNHGSPRALLADLGMPLLYGFALAFVALAVLRTMLGRPSPWLRSVLGMGSGGFVWLFIVAEAMVQVLDDVVELKEVSQGRVKEWNYRWKVKDWGSGRG